MEYKRLLARYPLISDQITTTELGVVLRELENLLAASIDGAIVEFGCYSGTTSLFIRRLLDTYQDNREFHVYDSFAGLPSKSDHDRNAAGIDFTSGELAVSKRQFLENFRRAKLQPPVAHKGWFDQLQATDLPKNIAFAFLDGDFYESIKTSLQLVWPRLNEKAVILVHDYKRETLPGVVVAVEEFFKENRITQNVRCEANIGIIRY